MFRELIKKYRNIIVTLRFSILSIFVSLFLITTISIILITSYRFSHTLSYTSFLLSKYATDTVLNELDDEMEPAAVQNQLTAKLIEKGVLKDEESLLVPYTLYVAKSLPLVERAFWSDEHGDFIFAAKEKNGTITTEIYRRRGDQVTHKIYYRDAQDRIIKQVDSPDVSYDPRTQPWYIAATKVKHHIWTDIYLSKLYPHLGIASVIPIYYNNQFQGVFGLNIGLDTLTQFITKQKISPNGYSFIVTAKEFLVAYPQRQPFTYTTAHKNQLINIHQVSLPLIDISLDLYKKTGQENLAISYQNDTYLVSYTPVKEMAEYGWLVGVVIPRKDFIGELQRMNTDALSISTIILIFGIILVSGLVTQIVKPIKLLVKETQKIKEFNLDYEVKIKSRIKEVINLSNSIHAMRIGLKSFQRYVPKILVKQLIEAGEDIRIGGERKQLAVFFSDIENFTSISEKMDPNLLMIQLCEYFEALSHIIVEQHGTIDKYIGDSIMAFWGAPLIEELPCYHAALVALMCRKKSDELNKKWEQEGKPRLVTRIGIHAGEAIVGNLGSSERINYTALGDTINAASRFEEINKLYKTKIIVSETVYQNIKDKFILRMVDLVSVKGRQSSSYIYELLSDDIQSLTFDFYTYQDSFVKGFKAYQERHWDDAIKHFMRCLEIYSADTLAPIFIERCKRYKINPPPADWDGIAKN